MPESCPGNQVDLLGEAPSTTSSSGGGGTALRAGADIAMERRTSLRGSLIPEARQPDSKQIR